MAVYDGDAFPGWSGNLFIGALAHQKIQRVVLDGRTVAHQETLLDDDLGRIRDVRTGPDGFLYILTDASDGGLFRLEPVD
jgi:glucose/arabinose dehydrogenase